MSAAVISPNLFEAARLGDPQAIASLLETAQPDIRRYARATCRSSADAEDATQEALWILFRHVGTIRSWLAFSAWLFSVVRRECLRLARKAGLAPAIDGGEAEALLLSRPEADLRLDVAAAFEALPPRRRHARPCVVGAAPVRATSGRDHGMNEHGAVAGLYA